MKRFVTATFLAACMVLISVKGFSDSKDTDLAHCNDQCIDARDQCIKDGGNQTACNLQLKPCTDKCIEAYGKK